MSRRALTLIEVLVIITITGILAALLIPAICSSMKQARERQAEQAEQQAEKQAELEQIKRELAAEAAAGGGGQLAEQVVPSPPPRRIQVVDVFELPEVSPGGRCLILRDMKTEKEFLVIQGSGLTICPLETE